MNSFFSDFFRINIGHVAASLAFICAHVWSQAKTEERIALLDQRDIAHHREAVGLVSATRSERGLMIDAIARRVDQLERSQAATDALLTEVRTLNAKLGALDQRISELREDMRRTHSR